jgi:hypothetical protein
MLPNTAERVTHNTSQELNRQIQAEIEDSVRWHAAHPERIGSRLLELDDEWDVERTLEANAATLAFSGTVLAATVDRRFLLVPAIVTAFLFQHAVQGWCPPLPVLRRLGFRTAREIETERMALKAIRGDFSRVGESGDKASAALQAARA